MTYADIRNPQSFNLYSYAQNNPMTNVDPTGLDCVYFNDAGNSAESVDHNSNSDECGQHGGDWVNGTTSASQVQYNGSNDTFSIQSSSALFNYNTTASAPGSQTDGVACYGNCDTATGYSQSFKTSGQLYDTLDAFLNSQLEPLARPIMSTFAHMDAWSAQHNALEQRIACNLSPANVMETREAMNTVMGVHNINSPYSPSGNTDAGGASNIYMPNVNSRGGFGPMGSGDADSKFNAAGMAGQYAVDRAACLQ